MSRAGNTTNSDSVDREDRTRQIIRDCIRKQANGEAIAHDALICAYPELMPELGDQLRRLRVIDSAHREAASSDDVAPHGLHIRCPHCHNSMRILDDELLSDLVCPACDCAFRLIAPSESEEEESQPTCLGNFQLIKKLGVGAFGTVWSARDTELDRTVAVKIPRKGVLDVKEIERFVREARTAAQLSHPNIVGVLEVGREQDCVYIVTDYVDGQDLADWLIEQKATPREAAALCATIADALEHAHQRGVIHRDLKPSNIMIDGNGEPHLMDFGLAKREATDVTMTVDGKLLGTPAYMSPEQARGAASQADQRCDIYSLGVILFELLTGERPFRGTTRMLVRQTLLEDAPSPRKLNSTIPKDLETICLKCLEKDPSLRYHTAAALAGDLHRFLLGQAVCARPISRAARTWRWCKRNPAPAVLAAAFVMAVAVGFAGVTSMWMRAEAARKSASVEAELRRRQQYFSDIVAAQEAWMANDVERCVELLSRFRTPDARRDDLRHFEWYYLWKLCEPNQLAPTIELDGIAGSVTFAPDGKLAVAGIRTIKILEPPNYERAKVLDNAHMFPISGLAFRPGDSGALATCSLDESLKLWSPYDSDLPHVLYGRRDDDPRCDYFYGLSFSPDGRWLAANHPEKGALLLWNMDERELIGSFEIVDRSGIPVRLYGPEFSPDGEHLAIPCHDGMVRLWNMKTRQQEDLWHHENRARGLAFSADGNLLASSGDDGVVQVGNVHTKEVLVRFEEKHSDRAFAVAISPNGKLLATGSDDRTVRLWDLETYEPRTVIKAHSGAVRSVAFSPDGKTLASAGWDGKVRLWDLTAPTVPDPLPGRAMAFSAKGDTLVTWTDPNIKELRQWITATCSPVPMQVPTNTDDPHALSSDGRLVAIGNGHGDIEIWDPTAQETRTQLAAHTDAVEFVTFSRGGEILASASQGTLKLWDTATFHPLGQFDAIVGANDLSTARYTFCISPDGRTLAYARDTDSGDFAVELWDVRKNESLQVILLDNPASSAAFSRDGSVLAIGHVTGMVVLWDVEGGHLIRKPFRAHSDMVFSLAFSPDGRRLASGASGSIKLWDLPSGNYVMTLREQNDTICRLAFSPDGTTLASAGYDNKEVRLWRAAAHDGVRITVIPFDASPNRIAWLSVMYYSVSRVDSSGQPSYANNVRSASWRMNWQAALANRSVE